MLSSVRFCPLPATRRRKPDWLGGVAPAEPAAGDSAVIWDVHGFTARAFGPSCATFAPGSWPSQFDSLLDTEVTRHQGMEGSLHPSFCGAKAEAF